MANRGVYSREDNSPEAVGRSIQTWNQQKSIDARFMEIYPTYHDIIYPHETIRIKPTMFVRSIPMVAPVLSRIRIVTRFYAVPIRILWQPWEKYIDISNEDYDFTLEEPYLINCTQGYYQDYNFSTGQYYSDWQQGSGRIKARVNFNYTNGHLFSDPRQFQLKNGFVYNDFVKFAQNPSSSNYPRGALFVFPHDLLDYFDAPIGVDISPYQASSSTTTLGANSVRFNAYKAAAYQLCYSFGYRLPNVQKRLDDYYQMAKSDDYEFAPAIYGEDFSVSPHVAVSLPTVEAASSAANVKNVLRKPIITSVDSNGVRSNVVDASYTDDKAQSSDSEAVLRTSWDKTELFPLKAGANASLQAWRLNSYGSLEFVPSNISLTRKRFANWSMDYFTSSNPWQQRGTEAQIPLSGNLTVTLPNSTTVTLSGLTVNVPETHTGAILYEAGTGRYLGKSPEVRTYVGDSSQDTSSHWAYSDIELRIPDNYSDVKPATGILMNPEITASASGSATASFSSASATVSNGLFVSPSNFRFAMALQKIKEMSARTDGRYKHYLSKFFGSFVHDDRIDYPEFLGGMVQDLNIDVVTQQSESNTTDLGTLAGNGVSAKSGYQITYHAKEHTIILALTHIVPDARYNGGLDRQDNCSDPYDWMLPQFSGLSEQPVYNSELACVDSWDSTASNRVVFGYEPYLNYLRGKQSRANGAFRDSFNWTGSYEHYKPWIIQRDFGKSLIRDGSGNVSLRPVVPTLSDEFLSGRGTTDNSMFTVADDRLMYPFIIDSAFKVRATRNIPSRGIPRI